MKTPITSRRLAALRSDLSHVLLSISGPEAETLRKVYDGLRQIEQELGPLADPVATGDAKAAHLQLVKLMGGQKGAQAA